MKIKTEESDESEEESAFLLQRKWEVKRQLQRKSPGRSTTPLRKSPARVTSPKNKVLGREAGGQGKAGVSSRATRISPAISVLAELT